MKHLILAGWFMFITMAAQSQTGDLETAKQAWKSQQYDVALDQLRNLPDAVYNKKAFQVDYMVSTSLCRLPDAPKGRRMITWMLDVYNLSGYHENILANELSACGSSGLSTPTIVTTSYMPARGETAAGVVSKSYYRFEDKNALTRWMTYIDTLSEVELEKRKILKSDSSMTLEKVQQSHPNVDNLLVSENFILYSMEGRQDDAMAGVAKELEKVIGFFKEAYGFEAPEHYINIFLCRRYALEEFAETYHKLDVPDGTLGYSMYSDLSCVAYIPLKYTGTLRHELFHILSNYNFNAAPAWLDEGYAALYEVSNFSNGELKGLPNWRGDILEDERSLTFSEEYSISNIMKMNWDEYVSEDRKIPIVHGKSRYFVLYLQEMGVHLQLYKSVQGIKPWEVEGDQSDIVIRKLEEITNIPITELEEKFERWLKNNI